MLRMWSRGGPPASALLEMPVSIRCPGPCPRREVAIWWPQGHSTDEFCLAFPVLGYVAFFSLMS